MHRVEVPAGHQAVALVQVAAGRGPPTAAEVDRADIGRFGARALLAVMRSLWPFRHPSLVGRPAKSVSGTPATVTPCRYTEVCRSTT